MNIEIPREDGVAVYRLHTIPGNHARELWRTMVELAGAPLMEVAGAFVLSGVTKEPPKADTIREAWDAIPALLTSDKAWRWVDDVCAYCDEPGGLALGQAGPEGRRVPDAGAFDRAFAMRPTEPLALALEVATRAGFFSLRGATLTSVVGKPAKP
jgi:hypothetical protein